jgi:hypothetical protein
MPEALASDLKIKTIINRLEFPVDEDRLSLRANCLLD